MREDLPVLQPMATISSLAYIFLGIIIWKKYKNKELLLLLILTGISSMFMHSTFSVLARTFDFLSIFLLNAWLFLNMQDKYRHKLMIYLLMVLMPSLVLFFIPKHPFILTTFVFIPMTLLTFLHKGNKNIRRAIVSIVLACACFFLDQNKVLCFHSINLHGHTLWHIFTMSAVYFYYRFILERKSETRTDSIALSSNA
ncbi:hypothetical protein [Bacteriovorax sp. BSW11_IV]|uniref:hypothetical protein n=1 Tax=Bacteriovorax sp. BSW11_IV TaxID=1353529 RepID=UPI0012DE88C1|nr:hypothetical protein [Bacteriovorax sp. BSW11_IV]